MTDGELPTLSVDDAARILAQIRVVVGDRSVVLVGGQAIVLLWGEQLKDYGLDSQDVEDSAIEVIVDGPGEQAVSLWVFASRALPP